MSMGPPGPGGPSPSGPTGPASPGAPVHEPGSLLEAVKMETAEKEQKFTEKLSRGFSKNPAVREYLGAGLSVLSLGVNLSPFAMPINLAVKTARALVGTANYSAIGGKMAVERQMKKIAPELLEESDYLIDEIEAGTATPEEEERFRELLGQQIGYYRQGIDLERFRPQAPTAPGTPTPPPAPPTTGWRGAYEKGKQLFTNLKEKIDASPRAKTALKLAWYAAPTAAALLAPALAPALMVATTGTSLVERVQRIRELRKNPEARGSEALETSALGQLIDRYQNAIGLHSVDATNRDDLDDLIDALNVSANASESATKRTTTTGAVVGGGLAAIFYGATWGAHPAHAAEKAHDGQTHSPHEVSTAQDNQAASASRSGMPYHGTSQPDTSHTTSTDGHGLPVHGQGNSAGTTGEPTHGSHASTDTIHGTSPSEKGMPYHGVGKPDTAGPTHGHGGPEMKGPETGNNHENPQLELFKKDLDPKFANHETGKVFEQDGKHWMILDLDDNHKKSAAELFEVVKDSDGKQYVMVTWADIHGHDGIPEHLSDHAVKVELPANGIMPSIGHHFGYLVDKQGHYVTIDDNNHSHVVDKAHGTIFNFEKKADVVHDRFVSEDGAIKGEAGWKELEKQLGERETKPDWSHFVARSGTMATLENGVVPEIQVQRVGEELVANWHGFTIHFSPEEMPRNFDELLAKVNGNVEMAHALEKTAFAYNHLDVRADTITIPHDSIDHFVDMLNQTADKTFSPDTAQTLHSLLADPASRAAVVNIIKTIHDDHGAFDYDQLMHHIGLDIVKPIIEVIPSDAPKLDHTSLASELSKLVSDIKYHESPLLISLHAAKKTLLRWGDNISDIRLIPDESHKKDILSLMLSDGRLKQFVIPKGALAGVKQ